MKSFFLFLFRSFTASFTSVLILAICYLAFDQTFLSSLLLGLLGGAGIFYSLKWYSGIRFLRKNGLSRRDYKYIRGNLKEAKLKINRLQKALIHRGNISDMKQSFDILRIVNKIYVITKREPKRFFQAERFYFSHLDSIVELTEKYAFLHSQPSKTAELANSLYDTRLTINQLADSLEKDLYILLEDDIDHLQFELDVAKQELKKFPVEIDDRRK